MSVGLFGRACRVTFIVAVVSALSTPSFACRVSPDYFAPSNYELVELADAIVIATPVAQGPTGEAGPRPRPLTFRTTGVLKGPALDTVTVSGTIGEPFRSDPKILSEANKEASYGGCVRTTFAVGEPYVLFLGKLKDGGYGPLQFPFARVNEDYLGGDSLWVKTIRTYVRIQRDHGRMEALDALADLLRQTLAAPKSAERDALARDIADHLASPSPYKPTAFLVQAYEALERGEQPKFGLKENGDENKARTRILQALASEGHADAAVMIERLLAAPKVSDEVLGNVLRFLAANGQYRRAYSLIETKVLPRLVGAGAQEVTALLSVISQVQNERWRSDPEVAAAWPELALRLDTFRRRMTGEGGFWFSDAIAEIKITDYRSRPKVTLALAESYDEKVVAWAVAELMDEAALKKFETADALDLDAYEAENDKITLPLQALAVGSGKEREAALKAVFCQGPYRREILFDVLGQFGTGLDMDLIASFADPGELSENDRKNLALAVIAIHGREKMYSSSAAWIWLNDFMAGRNASKKAVRCPA
jgi:hypothetical protein